MYYWKACRRLNFVATLSRSWVNIGVRLDPWSFLYSQPDRTTNIGLRAFENRVLKCCVAIATTLRLCYACTLQSSSSFGYLFTYVFGIIIGLVWSFDSQLSVIELNEIYNIHMMKRNDNNNDFLTKWNESDKKIFTYMRRWDEMR